MASRTRAGHSGEGGRGAREKVAPPAPLSLADAVIAIMRDPKVKLPPPYDCVDAPTPPALRVEDAHKRAYAPEGRGEEKSVTHDSPEPPASPAIAQPRVTPRVEPRDHDVERIVSDPHPGYRWI
jgi:hypothetical protein